MKATHVIKSIAALTVLSVFAAGCSGGSGTSVRPSPVNPAPTNGLIGSGSSGIITSTPSIGSSSTTVGFGATDTVSDIAATQAAQNTKLDQILKAANSANSNAKSAKSSANWAMWLGVGAVSLLALERIGNAIYHPGNIGDKLLKGGLLGQGGEPTKKAEAAEKAANSANATSTTLLAENRRDHEHQLTLGAANFRATGGLYAPVIDGRNHAASANDQATKANKAISDLDPQIKDALAQINTTKETAGRLERKVDTMADLEKGPFKELLASSKDVAKKTEEAIRRDNLNREELAAKAKEIEQLRIRFNELLEKQPEAVKQAVNGEVSALNASLQTLQTQLSSAINTMNTNSATVGSLVAKLEPAPKTSTGTGAQSNPGASGDSSKKGPETQPGEAVTLNQPK